MAELDDLIKNVPFTCQKCGAGLTADWLIAAAVTYGVALLAGEKDGWIGWSCPGCQGLAANFTRLARAPFDQVVDAVREASESAIFGRLCYRSFPYRNTLKDGEFSGRASMGLDGDVQALVEEHLFPDEPDFKPPAAYCSYIFGSEAAGPAISVWWYEEFQVEKLIERENETGLRLFPRYIVHNPLYSTIDDFCWHNRVHFDYLKTSGLPFDIKEIFLSSEKKRTTRAVDFLLLLDTVHSAELSSLSQGGFQAFISPPTITSGLIAPAESPPGKISILQHEKLSTRVWAAFHADWMQEILENLAEEFIADYLRLIDRIDCSLPAVWALKESYLKTLFDAVSSRYRREKIRKETNAKMRQRVLEAEKSFPDIKIISDDPRINELKIRIAKVAPLEPACSFLILGDRGTGKDLFARAIHAAGKPKGPLVKVDCGAIPEKLFETEVFGYARGAFTNAVKDSPGKFGAAAGGTIFFDEIANLPLALQPKLLRALQDREYVPVGSNRVKRIDARFLFATNRDLEAMVEEGAFMPDLYDRLKRPQFTVPPLRERSFDVPLLAAHFIERYDLARKSDRTLNPLSLSKECADTLKKLDWPGNIRDLEQVIMEIVLERRADNDRSDISESDLPEDLFARLERAPASRRKIRKRLPGNTKVEDEDIIRCMKELGHNKTRTAEQLGVCYKTIWQRCKRIGL